ncbi:MAG: transposase [Bacteroidota bacterium]|nr:transposase [Bacteroidota bacterium]
MKDKYQNKYRIASARLQNWDYGWNAAYFITICTKNREHFFGEIADGKMQLSEIGKNAKKYLIEIPQRFDYAKLDEFVVMPNHIHAIIVIDKNNDGGDGNGDGNGDGDGDGKDAINRVSTIK